MPQTATIAYKNFSALKLENAFARLIVIPEIGGKTVSIQSCVTGREFLWQDDSRPYRLPRYGDAFGNYDASGFDECFPTIGECLYPEFPWEGITVPDHGELWTIPWQYELSADSIYLHTYGVHFPYHFEKQIALAQDAGRFTITYRITNLSPFSMKYMWSAHPLFAAQEGMRIVMPGHAPMRFTFAAGDRIGGAFLQEYQWPWAATPAGEPIDYGLIGSAKLAANDKFYARAPEEGWCALYHEGSGQFVGIGFNPHDTPYVGICINHGGWPFEGVPGYWVALEPCTGYPDPLTDVVQHGQQAVVPGQGSVQWTLTLFIGQTPSAEAIGQMMSH